MAVTIGRLRLQEKSLRMFLLVNNLVRGAAGNCLLSAELAYELGYLNWGE
jgi:aspartate-semialdehyde dehydrogenase